MREVSKYVVWRYAETHASKPTVDYESLQSRVSRKRLHLVSLISLGR